MLWLGIVVWLALLFLAGRWAYLSTWKQPPPKIDLFKLLQIKPPKTNRRPGPWVLKVKILNSNSFQETTYNLCFLDWEQATFFRESIEQMGEIVLAENSSGLDSGQRYSIIETKLRRLDSAAAPE